MKAHLLLVTILLAFVDGSDTLAQAVRVHVPVDTVRVGEPFTFSLAADHAPGEEILFLELPRTRVPESGPLLQFGDVEILEADRLPPVVKGNVRTDSILFRGVAFVLDTARVGPIPVRHLADGDTTVIPSSVATLFVASEAAAGDEPADLLDPIPFPDPRPIWMAIGILGVALLSLAGWGLLRLRRSGRPPHPKESPIAEARRRLDALARLDGVDDEPREPHIELSDMLRTYIERRLKIPALELTTGETSAALTDDGRTPDSIQQAIRNILTQSDLVKFAEMHPPAGAWKPLLAQTRDTIEALELDLIRQMKQEQAEANLKLRTGRGASDP